MHTKQTFLFQKASLLFFAILALVAASIVWLPATGWAGETAPAEPVRYVKNDCVDINVRADNCGIIGLLKQGINILSALVGVVVVGMIISGGIQYSSAGDNPQKIQAAKSRIYNALLALVVFAFMYAFLQWLVPGGVF